MGAGDRNYDGCATGGCVGGGEVWKGEKIGGDRGEVDVVWKK